MALGSLVKHSTTEPLRSQRLLKHFSRREKQTSLVAIGVLWVSINIMFSKGVLAWYGKLTWESAHAWNLIILCYLIVCRMTFISMVYLSFYAIPLLIYDVMNDITIIP